MKIIFSYLLMLSISIGSYCQCTSQLVGKIIDADTKLPLAYAEIILLEQNIKTFSDEKGSFVIENICNGIANLKIIHKDCLPIEQHIHIKNSINNVTVELPHEYNQLNEIKVNNNPSNTTKKNTLSQTALEAFKGFSLAQAIAQINGVHILQTGTNIYKPIIQGMHGSRVLILNNGIRQEGQQWGSEHAPEMDVYLANKITIIKGASAIQYGADAIGGTVLFEPKPLALIKSKNTEINTALHSNNLMGVLNFMHEQKTKSNFKWRSQFTMARGGFSKTPNYWLANSSKGELNFSLAGGWLNENKGAEIFFSQFNTTLGIFKGAHIGNTTDLMQAIENKNPPDYIRNVNFSYSIDRPKQDVQHNLLKVKLYKQNNNWLYKLNLSSQYNHRQEYDVKRFATSNNNPQLDLQLFTQAIDLTAEQKPNSNYNSSFGANLQHQLNNYTYRLFIPNFEAINIGGFYVGKLKSNKATHEIGLRYDYRLMYNITKNDGSEYNEKSFGNFSGSFGTRFDFLRTETKNATLYANLSFAWRAPNVNELFTDGLHHGAARIETGDPNIKPEKASTLNLGLDFISNKQNSSIEFFAKNINDFIYLNPDFPPQLTIRGAFPSFKYKQSNAFIWGIDVSNLFNLDAHWFSNQRLSMLFAKNKSTSSWIVGMPQNKYEIDLGYKEKNSKWFNNWESSLQLQYFSEQKRIPPTGNIEIKNPDGSIKMASDYAPPPTGYVLFNFQGNVSLNEKYTIGLLAQNILNNDYRNYLNAFRYFGDEAGRNIVLKLKMNI